MSIGSTVALACSVNLRTASPSAVFINNSIVSIKEPTVEREKSVITKTSRTGELPLQNWETPFRRLEGVTIERAGGIEPVQVTGTIDGMPLYFRSRMANGGSK